MRKKLALAFLAVIAIILGGNLALDQGTEEIARLSREISRGTEQQPEGSRRTSASARNQAERTERTAAAISEQNISTQGMSQAAQILADSARLLREKAGRFQTAQTSRDDEAHPVTQEMEDRP